MKLKIETGETNTILRLKSKYIEKIDKKIIKTLKEMGNYVINNNATGLSAPQIGQNLRMFTMLAYKDNNFNDYSILYIINPEIISFSKESEIDTEGCLSLPNVWEKIKRPKTIKVSFLNLKGEKCSLELQCLNARTFQHELDHLEGVLFTDKI